VDPSSKMFQNNMDLTVSKIDTLRNNQNPEYNMNRYIAAQKLIRVAEKVHRKQYLE
jgi:hypothetical protein